MHWGLLTIIYHYFNSYCFPNDTGTLSYWNWSDRFKSFCVCDYNPPFLIDTNTQCGNRGRVCVHTWKEGEGGCVCTRGRKGREGGWVCTWKEGPGERVCVSCTGEKYNWYTNDTGTLSYWNWSDHFKVSVYGDLNPPFLIKNIIRNNYELIFGS